MSVNFLDNLDFFSIDIVEDDFLDFLLNSNKSISEYLSPPSSIRNIDLDSSPDSSHFQIIDLDKNNNIPSEKPKLSQYNLIKTVFQNSKPFTPIRLKDIVSKVNNLASSTVKNASIRHTLCTEPCFINMGTKVGWLYDETKDKQGKTNSKLRRKY